MARDLSRNVNRRVLWRMRTQMRPIFAALNSAILISTILLTSLAVPGQAVILTVASNGSADYTSIQNAIDAAGSGDVIEVFSGTYQEHIFVNKQVELLGKDTGAGLPLVDANGTGSAITMYSNGAVLKGFNVTNSGHCGCGNAGIRIMSDNNTISGNVAYKDNYGIYAGPTKGNRIYQNDLIDNYISAFDEGSNIWGLSPDAKGLLMDSEVTGNHYSDFDNPAAGCNDTSRDGICDRPYKIKGGSNVDFHPLVELNQHQLEQPAHNQSNGQPESNRF
jgi:parallel beta-helix repeat protein